MKNIKLDPKKVLPIVSGLIGIAGMVVTGLVESNNRKALKTEIKDEVLKEILSEKN